MTPDIQNIGLAISFSPNSMAHLSLAISLCKRWKSSLTLMYVGKSSPDVEEKFGAIKDANQKDGISTEIIMRSGDPAKNILSVAKEKQVQLLLAGALEREDLKGYYVGSVARKLMRSAQCSTLILTSGFLKNPDFKKIFVTAEFSDSNELALVFAADFARIYNASLGLIREFQVPGLAMAVGATGSTHETSEALQKWKREEEEKMDLYIREHDFSRIPLTKKCIYGKEGFESQSYAKEQHADLFIMNAPVHKLSIWDRIFQHDVEYVLKELPCSVLLVR